jgi:hypothetical protein
MVTGIGPSRENTTTPCSFDYILKTVTQIMILDGKLTSCIDFGFTSMLVA